MAPEKNKKIDKKLLFASWASKNEKWHAYQMWHLPLRKIFTNVVDFDPQQLLLLYGKDKMNKMFLETIKKEKPDCIFLWLMHDEFYLKTLIRIKKILPAVKIVTFCGDDDIKFYNYTTAYLPITDYILATQDNFFPLYKEYGTKFFQACGTDIEKFRFLNLKKKYDVCFLGTDKADRVEYMRHLLKNKINVLIFGAGWDKYPEFKMVSRGKISDEEFTKIMNQTCINVCLSKNYFNVVHAIERFLMANACKSFVLTEYAPGYFPKFKEGYDIVTFKNKEELLNKIKYYLNNEREREEIAGRAYKKTVKSYSNQKLLWDAFSAIEKENPNPELPKINKRIIYLTKEELSGNLGILKNKLADYDLVCFKNKLHETLQYRNYFQAHSMNLLKKPISICNSYLSSKVIGDYMTLDLYYAYNYLKDRSYFYDNADISQFMVTKEFFIKNVDKFASLYNGGKATFVNPDNTSFISMQLVRAKKIKKIPIRDMEHILFSHIDLELIVLKNQGRLIRNSYLYRLIFYSLFVNPRILRYILINAIKRTKNKFLVTLSKIFNLIF